MIAARRAQMRSTQPLRRSRGDHGRATAASVSRRSWSGRLGATPEVTGWPTPARTSSPSGSAGDDQRSGTGSGLGRAPGSETPITTPSITAMRFRPRSRRLPGRTSHRIAGVAPGPRCRCPRPRSGHGTRPRGPGTGQGHGPRGPATGLDPGGFGHGQGPGDQPPDRAPGISHGQAHGVRPRDKPTGSGQGTTGPATSPGQRHSHGEPRPDVTVTGSPRPDVTVPGPGRTSR